MCTFRHLAMYVAVFVSILIAGIALSRTYSQPDSPEVFGKCAVNSNHKSNSIKLRVSHHHHRYFFRLHASKVDYEEYFSSSDLVNQNLHVFQLNADGKKHKIPAGTLDFYVLTRRPRESESVYVQFTNLGANTLPDDQVSEFEISLAQEVKTSDDVLVEICYSQLPGLSFAILLRYFGFQTGDSGVHSRGLGLCDIVAALVLLTMTAVIVFRMCKFCRRASSP